MHIRTQLLGAFLGVTVLALVMYGVSIYQIAPDMERGANLNMLEHWAAELAGHATEDHRGKGIDRKHLIESLRERQLSPDALVVLEDGKDATVVVGKSLPGLNRQVLDTIIPRTGEIAHGSTLIGGEEYLWLNHPLRGTAYSVTLAEPLSNYAAGTAHKISMRLLTTGLIVVWFAIWAALILASVIARKLNEKNATLIHQARHDSLTGLPNRTLIYEKLREMIARDKPQRFALLVMDLNGFKEVNNTLGHYIGDQILMQVGTRVASALRDDDLVARLGGDEFAVLVPDTDLAQGMACAERIMRCFAEAFPVGEITLVVRPSIGIACYPTHGEDADTLIRCADVAMYNAKRDLCGYEAYKTNVDIHNVRRLTLMSDLHSAIEDGQLELYYQPKVEMNSRRLVGAEALLRWRHADYGFVPPDEFIPLAEQSGMIRPLTDWVLDQAFRQCAQWCSEGLNIGVAVNISAYSLNNQDFPQGLYEALRRWELPAHLVELEITESAMMYNLELAGTILRQLDAMGVRIAIDDFGTGFSSLTYLQRLPVDALKIDKSFVIGMAEGDSNGTIVRSIIDLGRNMGLEVVAEGVEDSVCFDTLARAGCNTAQGYFIAKPMPAQSLAKWMAESPWEVKRSVVALHAHGLRGISN